MENSIAYHVDFDSLKRKNRLVLVRGSLAAGKSTFVKKIKERFNTLTFSKDNIKEVLGDTVGFSNREENLKLSNATFGIFCYLLKQLKDNGYPLVFEANFHQKELDMIYVLAEENDYEVLTLDVTGDTRVLFERFMYRYDHENRHPVHKSASLNHYEAFKTYDDIDRNVVMQGNVISIFSNDFSYQSDENLYKNLSCFFGIK